MREIDKDHYGKKIVPGVMVAFNYQGEVRIGIVQSVNPKVISKWHGHINAKIAHSDDQNVVSTVKRSSSIAVL